MRKLILTLSVIACYVQVLLAQTTVTVPIQSSSDDAEQYIYTPENDSYRTEGSMDVASSDIEIGAEKQNGVNPSIAGLRFADMQIPAGVMILSAEIVFTVDKTEKNEDPAEFEIFVEDNVNSLTFTEDDNDLTSRTWHDQSVQWNFEAGRWSVEGEKQSTADISSLVQMIVNKKEWGAGNALTFFIKGTGVREAESYDGAVEDHDDESLAPTLVVTYIPVNKITAQIGVSSDDAEEYIFTPENDSYRTEGSMDVGSSDIEIGAEKQNGVNPSIAGLRFADLQIPAGAKVLSAEIVFTVDKNDKNEDPAEFKIYVEDNVNAPTFTETDADISSRTWLDNSVAWKPEAGSWAEIGSEQKTTDISELVQAIVNKEEWATGNAMAFSITGTGVREAESYDGAVEDHVDETLAPKLMISYIPVAKETYHISTSTDDAEEYIYTPENDSYRTEGSMDVGSSDIEIGAEKQNGVNPSIAGLRFDNLSFPKNAMVESAHLVFTVDKTEKNEDPAKFEIWVENNATPATFAEEEGNITARTWSQKSIVWELEAGSWNEIGKNEYSVDVSELIEFATSKDDWAVGNAIAFFIKGTGVREAESYDGAVEDHDDESLAPKLMVEYLQGEIVYKPELVYEIPDQNLKAGWDLTVDVTPHFKDNDSELSFYVTDLAGRDLPEMFTFENGILNASVPTVKVVNIKVWAVSEGDTVTDIFKASFEPIQQPLLKPISTVKLGAFKAGAAEISAYDAGSKRLFVTNAELNALNIIDMADPAKMVILDTIELAVYGGGINSVAVHNGMVAAAIEADVKQDAGKVVVFDVDGNELWNVTAGALPDMVSFNNDGTKIIVANEGEPSGDYLNDPEGSISIIDVETKTVETADFLAFNAEKESLIANGVRIFGPNATVAQDLEPEYITVQGDIAYVTCQENNALAIVEISTAKVLELRALGFKDHSVAGNGLDLPGVDDIFISPLPIKGMYNPDAISSYTVGDKTYLITANEGDAREYFYETDSATCVDAGHKFDEEDGCLSFTDESKIKKLDLDPTIFDVDFLTEYAGGLKVTTSLADTNANGEFQTLYSYGSRSFTIWDAETGAVVFESGDQFEQITASLNPDFFNTSNSKNKLKDRSDDKGPEPEAVTVGTVGDKTYAFVGLERVGGVMVYDITDPNNVSFVEYTNNRDFIADIETPEAGDSGPEGIFFVSADDSGNNTPLVVVSNEISGTVTAYSVGEAVAPFTLAVFHNNDGESDLLADSIIVKGEKTTGGSISQFKHTLDGLRTQAQTRGYESIMLSSGDNFLAGLEYNASQANGVFYDAVALDALDYDAIDLGNHDFDFGTTVLSQFINAFENNKAPYLSSNLSFENVPELQALVDAGRIAPSTIIEKSGEKIGVIGLTTPLLPVISSPGNTTVSEAIVDSVQKQLDILKAEGVNKIILISHLQNLDEEKMLASKLSGVDIIIAGGGDELISNDPNIGKPYNIAPVASYPVVVKDSEDKDVYVVTTPGNYRYLGNLLVDFNAEGEITRVYDQSDLVLIHGERNEDIYTQIEKPIEEYIGELSTNVIAQAEDKLDFLREGLRKEETNGGNLFADALLWQAKETYAGFGVKEPHVAIQNSGGLRIESIIEPGDFTEDLTYEIAAFTNILSVIEDIEPVKFLELIEHGVAKAPKLDGRFPQIAGFKIVYDPAAEEGNKVKEITLNDGTEIVKNSEVVADAPNITLATIDFTANGGDGYPFAPLTYKTLGATYQQAFLNYLKTGLNGTIAKADYPYMMNERIIEQVTIAPAIDTAKVDFAEVCPTLPEGWNLTFTQDIIATCDAGKPLAFNGYKAGIGEATLVSPRMNFDESDYDLHFTAENKYGRNAGLDVVVLFSTDYDGVSDVSKFTWDTVHTATDFLNNEPKPNSKSEFTADLSFITEEGYIAFTYFSDGIGGGGSSSFKLYELSIIPPAPVTEYGTLMISEIQGEGDASPYVDGRVTTGGFVTAFYNGVEPYAGAGYNADIEGFYIQTTYDDENELTSEGIFVKSDEVVAVGDSVNITAIVRESSGLTMLTDVTAVEIASSNNTLPAAVQIELALNDIAELEHYEGMLVNITNTLYVTENRNLIAHGEVRLSADDVLYQATQMVDPNDAEEGVSANGNTNVDAVNDQMDGNKASNIILNDARIAYKAEPYVYVDENNSLLAGSSIEGVTGVLDYSSGEYKINPTVKPEFNYAVRETATPLHEDASLRVVAFNVYNYFNGDGQGGGFPTARGAKTADEFSKQTQKIVATITELDADIVGLIELENDDTDLGSINSLVDSLNAELGSEVYGYINTGIVKRADGTADEIKNGFIYKTATVSPVGDYAILNDNFSTNYFDNFNRPAIAQTFEEIANGEKFTTVINHLKSKGSDCDDLGDENDYDGQGECNMTRAHAAGTIAAWLDTDPTASEDDDFIILGDLNSYFEEDPIDTLRALGYESLTDANDYTYVYDGRYGTLDYAMANESIEEQVAAAFNWHINSTEPSSLGYYGDMFEATPYRSSDHDPVVVDLRLGYVAVESLEITGMLSITEKGGTTQLTANILPEDATDKVVWSIEETEIETSIDQTGLVTASATNNGNGTVSVTATIGELSETVEIIISGQESAESVEITGTLTITEKSGTTQLSATVLPEIVTKAVTWSIAENTLGATIDETGLVTASGTNTGNGTVTVTATIDEVSHSVEVVISGQESAESVEITAESLTITEKGGTLQLTATVLPEIVTKAVIWRIAENTLGATINETGLVTASGTNTGNGTVTITAAIDEVSHSVEVVISGQEDVVGLEEKDVKAIAYPNPTKGVVSFSIPVTATVYNAIGVFVTEINNASQVNLSQHGTGLYIIKTESGQYFQIVVK